MASPKFFVTISILIIWSCIYRFQHHCCLLPSAISSFSSLHNVHGHMIYKHIVLKFIPRCCFLTNYIWTCMFLNEMLNDTLKSQSDHQIIQYRIDHSIHQDITCPNRHFGLFPTFPFFSSNCITPTIYNINRCWIIPRYVCSTNHNSMSRWT